MACLLLGTHQFGYGQAIGSWQAYPALEIVTANIPAGG